jgi:8-oxo-dGTP pyrophosphatase MutT (NUDIX family)
MRLEAVREQLRGYRPADETEAGYVTRMIELTLAAPNSACERSHFVPGHFTASAFVLSPDRRDLILIHHKKLGIWVQPGGHVEASDPDLLSAARREVAEEVGLGELDSFGGEGALFGGQGGSFGGEGALFDVDIHTIPARKTEPAHEHFDTRFAFVARTRDFARTEEVADVRWVPLERVGEITTDESVLRATKKLVALFPI